MKFLVTKKIFPSIIEHMHMIICTEKLYVLNDNIFTSTVYLVALKVHVNAMQIPGSVFIFENMCQQYQDNISSCITA